MTIEDQIRDEKIQYDTNRETTKISALSSGKINKYEYLTGEEILPSNEQQMTEESKFTYTPLGNAFEKRTKTIEDQREKKVKAIKIKYQFTYDINASPIVLKEKEIYNKLTEESLEKKNNLDEKVDTNKLVFRYKGKTADEDFGKFDNALSPTDKIRDGEVSLNEAKMSRFGSKWGEIKRVQKKHLLKERREARTNTENFYNARKAAIDFFKEYISRASEARR